jgi:hypothetical protein
VVIIYRLFGTTCRSHLHGSRFLDGKKACDKETWQQGGMKMGPTRCPESSVNNYHTTPCNYPKEHRLQTTIFCIQISSSFINTSNFIRRYVTYKTEKRREIIHATVCRVVVCHTYFRPQIYTLWGAVLSKVMSAERAWG